VENVNAAGGVLSESTLLCRIYTAPALATFGVVLVVLKPWGSDGLTLARTVLLRLASAACRKIVVSSPV
jgi:hypothetical protein